MIDLAAHLYGPIYAQWGVPATFTRATGGLPVSLTAIDQTRGVEVSKSKDLNTIAPAAKIRMPELTAAGLSADDLRRGTFTLNGGTWRIEGHKLVPGPGGEAAGEVLLILSKAT